MNKQYPEPVNDLKLFPIGAEIIDLKRAQSGYDCHFEVVDNERGIIRSMMTGEDELRENGAFLLLSDYEHFPKDLSFVDAKQGDFYRNLIDGSEYQVLEADDEHHVKLMELSSEEVRFVSRLGGCFFVKKNENREKLPPVDKNGQYLLFEF